MQIMRRVAAVAAVSALAFAGSTGAAMAGKGFNPELDYPQSWLLSGISPEDAMLDDGMPPAPSEYYPESGYDIPASTADKPMSESNVEAEDMMTPSGIVPQGGEHHPLPPTGGELSWSDWFAGELNDSFVLSASKAKVMPGEDIVFTITHKSPAHKAVGAEFNVEVHSKVYKLGKFKKEPNKDLKVTWKVPADMKLGAHKVLVPESNGGLVAMFEVVKPGKGGKGKANAKLAQSGATDVTALVALLGMAGAGVMIARRRMS